MSRKIVMKKTVLDPKKKALLSMIGSAMCDVKKIDSLENEHGESCEFCPCEYVISPKEFFSEIKSRTVYDSIESMPQVLQGIRADVIVTMDLEHELKTTALVYPVQELVDPKRVYTLPKYADNVIVRVVVVYGSHEVFFSKALGTKLGSTTLGTFVPQGSAIKILPSSGEFSYDNKNTYDSEMFAGGGRKHPTKRQLIIFDFISDSEESSKKIRDQEIDRITGLVTKIPQASSVILPLIQSLSSFKG